MSGVRFGRAEVLVRRTGSGAVVEVFDRWKPGTERVSRQFVGMKEIPGEAARRALAEHWDKRLNERDARRKA